MRNLVFGSLVALVISALACGSSGPTDCVPGLLFCPKACVDALNDPQNCGGCGVVCPNSEPCAGGACCGNGTTACANACVDTKTDAQNCGNCGVVCPSACVNGACQ